MDFDIIAVVATVIVNYVIFKLGEHYAYFKIARGLQNLKNHADLLGQSKVESTMEVEKIGEQYYAYHENNFVGQADSLDGIRALIEKFVTKNPGRFSGIRVQVKQANEQ